MILRSTILLLATSATIFAIDSNIVQTTQKSSQNGTSKLITESVDINKTVSEVEQILQKYPELPRIERSEILSILQNITEEDNEKLKEELTGVLEEETQKMQRESSKEQVEPVKNNGTRPQSSRSVMVVLPFKPEEQGDSLEELFTKSPLTIMEDQKINPGVTENAPFASDVSINKPGFSIIEKEDKKFNPPLRVIGLRYHTTSKPKSQSEESSKSYQNFQNPEQVTMAFRTEETHHGWNHKELYSTTEKLENMWNENINSTEPKFHVPDTMDNFSIEDAISGEPSEEEFPLDSIEVTQKPVTTTEKIFTTTPKPMKVKTTTERIVKVTRSPLKKKYRQKLTTTTSTTIAPTEKEIHAMLDDLPPNMKDMLSNIGIDESTSFTENTESPSIYPIRTVNANIDASSYQFFKPLPVKKQKYITDDMQQFLASFGLLDTNRQQKAIVETTTKFNDKYLDSAPIISTDFLTDDMKKTLDNLGLYDTTPPKKNIRKHIFNPKNVSTLQTEEEVKKLNSLLGTIKKLASWDESKPVTLEFQKEILKQVKELDNITISYKSSAAINEEIHKIMAKNKGKFKIPVIMKESSSINTLKQGLDPEFFEEIQLKNEVKRQENSSTTTESSSDTSSTTEESTSSTTEPANSAGLEDAFGGGDTAPAGSNPADALPPKRPNGLYLLLDWNTFFEVGTEDDSRRVNIRFQPKIGDGRNFLPVTIP